MLALAMFLGALLVAAWFGLGWVQARDLSRAQDLIGAPKLSAAQARDASSLLDSAATLNPDRAVEITRGQLYAKLHDPARAVALLQGVTRAEPRNLEAWRELSIAAFTPPRTPYRRRVAAHAFKQVLRLVAIQK
jgi:predicted Zn-dependent protease